MTDRKMTHLIDESKLLDGTMPEDILEMAVVFIDKRNGTSGVTLNVSETADTAIEADILSSYAKTPSDLRYVRMLASSIGLAQGLAKACKGLSEASGDEMSFYVNQMLAAFFTEVNALDPGIRMEFETAEQDDTSSAYLS